MESQNHLLYGSPAGASPLWIVAKRDGRSELFDSIKMKRTIERACRGYEKDVDPQTILKEIERNLFEGVTTTDLEKAAVLAACGFIERDSAYSFIAARLLRERQLRDVVGKVNAETDCTARYRSAFIAGIKRGVELEFLTPDLLTFDIERLACALKPERDELFGYTGLHTLYERYFLKDQSVRYELPQSFWMRVAMGLAQRESNKNERAIEFYEAMSTFAYVPSTPTLFHSGFVRAQLSSCYLNTVKDDLHHIFKSLGDNAQLAKWAGGIGTDWTNVRGTGSYIKSIKATSQGAVPYLKIANDIVVAITRSGIRRGGKCAYLELWHFDIEDFLDLRRNTGDERRRTHDMNTAVWVPDLFMKRVMADKGWMLFSPDEAPDLHEIYGSAFERRYEEYEARVRAGQMNLSREVPARQLWRKMLTRLFETGHPWITFKDACNIRSPQDHAGVIHSSNLCTEITLNTSEDETAVCNLGSINLGVHITNGQLDQQKLRATIRSAVRMLDNVIDLNFYPIKEAENSNLRHRPIGMGLMGFQDALYQCNISFASERAREFADESMEFISYEAISSSVDLAQERGAYSSFKGSKWDRGILPLDTINLLEQERGVPITVSRSSRLNWDALRQRIKAHGMRNSNVMAVAPTATISTIVGCYPCIEPIFKNIYVKANVSGEFTIVNTYLVEDLKKLGLWNAHMLNELKFHDGDVHQIAAIPWELKQKYLTAFDIDPEWAIEITAARGKWIDQSQSHNVFIKGVSGKRLERVYEKAFMCGLKTTYYMRTLGATQIEKSTLDASQYGFTQKRTLDDATQAPQQAQCGIDNENCESCQ